MMSQTKKQTSKHYNFFFIETIRLSVSVECLNSSPAQLAGELWPSANMAMVTFCRTIFHQNLGFRAIILDAEMLNADQGL